MASTIEFFFFDDELLPTIPITLSHAGFYSKEPYKIGDRPWQASWHRN